MCVRQTWSGGWKRLLKRLRDEVEVLTAMERNRNLGLAGLAQLVAPLQQRDRNRPSHHNRRAEQQDRPRVGRSTAQGHGPKHRWKRVRGGGITPPHTRSSWALGCRKDPDEGPGSLFGLQRLPVPLSTDLILGPPPDFKKGCLTSAA